MCLLSPQHPVSTTRFQTFLTADRATAAADAAASTALKVKCLHCGHVSERREKYRDVLLQVAGQEDLVSFESCLWGVGCWICVSLGFGALGMVGFILQSYVLLTFYFCDGD